jgi:ribosomal protein S18 acetylase RimI-like enzyme
MFLADVAVCGSPGYRAAAASTETARDGARHKEPTVTEPVRLAHAQRERAAETLVRAFRADPLYTYICPDEAERLAPMRGLLDALVRFTLLYGEGWTLQGVSGVACWLSPGNTTITVWQMLRTRFELPWAVLRFEGGARRRALDLFGYTDRVHHRVMSGRHWYLWALGVEPAAQGQGIGSSLLQPVLSRADAEGLPCYLETETERNVAFYRRHGFEVSTAERVAGHGPMLWFMTRAPRT